VARVTIQGWSSPHFTVTTLNGGYSHVEGGVLAVLGPGLPLGTGGTSTGAATVSVVSTGTTSSGTVLQPSGEPREKEERTTGAGGGANGALTWGNELPRSVDEPGCSNDFCRGLTALLALVLLPSS
jgi:hypothetical protein